MPFFEDISVEYEPGHDPGSRAARRLAASPDEARHDYDPTDKMQALQLLHETPRRGEYATGVLYIEPDKRRFPVARSTSSTSRWPSCRRTACGPPRGGAGRSHGCRSGRRDARQPGSYSDSCSLSYSASSVPRPDGHVRVRASANTNNEDEYRCRRCSLWGLAIIRLLWSVHSRSSSRTPLRHDTPAPSFRASRRRGSASVPCGWCISRGGKPRVSTRCIVSGRSSGSLTDFMSSGPAVVMALEAPDAIKKWRNLMGATDPAKADAGTIRKDFGAVHRAERDARLGCARDGGVRARLLLPRHRPGVSQRLRSWASCSLRSVWRRRDRCVDQPRRAALPFAGRHRGAPRESFTFYVPIVTSILLSLLFTLLLSFWRR